MNPIKITLLTLGTWVTLTILYMFTIEDVLEKPFVFAMYSFYLAPFVCIIAFSISSFFNRFWINTNKRGYAISTIILITWALCIIIYLKSLFI